ncbi:MAG TPA: S1 RNA-binding domain-containing protein, partial [Thermoanaerobaculia bacterium]|nr:S1 RNA-binding domain-containing protein [Thermoanaerobaculia bacterium]
DVTSVKDLEVGMVLEGRVSNVTNFGAFVDIGVKRDGLVHVSELCHRFVKDPREAVQVGQIVKVKVMEVDRERERIALSIKALETPVQASRPPQRTGSPGRAAGDARTAPRQDPRPEPGRGAAPSRPANKPAPRPEPRAPQKAAPEKPTLDDLMRKFNRR